MAELRGHDTGRTCRCVSEHRPKVMELQIHHVLPLSHGGAKVPSNEIWLCPTTHANVHEVLRLIERHEGAPPAELLRPYPRYARELAWEGWRRMQGKAA
jgi:hypothetical protein